MENISSGGGLPPLKQDFILKNFFDKIIFD